MADLICRKTMMRCQTPGMCSPFGGCQPSVLKECDVRYGDSSAEHKRGDWSELKRLAEAELPKCCGEMVPTGVEYGGQREMMCCEAWQQGEVTVAAFDLLQLIAENERLQGLACAVNSAMHEAGMPVDADPAELADVIYRLQVQVATLQKHRTELNMEAARLVEDADEMAADLVAARNGRDQLRSENEQQKEQIENFKVQFSELHVARNLLSTLSGAGFPLDEGAAESILAVRAERDQLRAEVEALRKDAERYRFVRELAWYVDEAAYVYEIGNSRSPWTSERASVDADDIEMAIDAAMGKGGRADG